MKKTLLIALFGTLFLIVTTAAITDVPDDITLTAKNGDVAFPHKQHCDSKLTCKTCHHTVANDMDEPTQKCHECHNSEADVNPKTAFHNSCVKCHKDTKKENKESKAPTKCKECHVKK